MNKIRFSNNYGKLPFAWFEGKEVTAKLISVCVIDDVNLLPKEFLNYDTEYYDEEETSKKHYILPKGKVLILLFSTISKFREDDYLTDLFQIFTTIRRWTPLKEKWYYSVIGEEFLLVDIREEEKNVQKGKRR